MTRNLRSIKSLFLFAAIIAVGLIVLGSLINFHQNKIWGKPLLSQMVAIKRDSEDLAKVFQASKNTSDGHLVVKFFASDWNIPGGSSIAAGSFACESAWCAFSERVPAFFCITSPGLRAPPAF